MRNYSARFKILYLESNKTEDNKKLWIKLKIAV